jgi:CRP/FNR family transcriptional regulator, cyclic AMP receptor protein
MQQYEAILSEHPFFKDLEPAYVRLIGGCATEECFNAGDYIFKLGEEANRFYLIRHGKVALELFTPARGIVNIETLDEGDMLGASWLFPPYVWQYEAHAVEFTRTISFDARCLRAACEDDHDLGYELMQRFAKILMRRLHDARLQMLDVYSTPKTARG